LIGKATAAQKLGIYCEANLIDGSLPPARLGSSADFTFIKQCILNIDSVRQLTASNSALPLTDSNCGTTYLFLVGFICDAKISCSCSKPLKVVGSQALNIVLGSMAFKLVDRRSCISRIKCSCMGCTSGRPKNARASSGVQSMFMVAFI